MSDEKALLAAIWEHPHEDTPRLMYADWLQEHGQPERAEFVRVQCEIARLDEWDDADRLAQLTAREEALRAAHANDWLPKGKKTLWGASFRRGFVYPRRLDLDGERFLKLKPKALDAAPQWNLLLHRLGRDFDAVFASPLLPRVDVLTLSGVKDPYDQFERLAGNELLRNVSELTMDGQQGMPESLVAFLGAPASAALVRLNLGDIDRFRFDALRRSAASSRLRHLQLSLFGQLPDGPLFDADTFPRLRSLDLREFQFSYNRDEADTLDRFFTGRRTTPLRRLNLSGCGITDAGMRQLTEWPGLANLRWLNLDRNRFGEAGLRLLAQSPFAANLKHLELDGWQLRRLPDVLAELDTRFGPALHYYRP